MYRGRDASEMHYHRSIAPDDAPSHLFPNNRENQGHEGGGLMEVLKGGEKKGRANEDYYYKSHPEITSHTFPTHSVTPTQPLTMAHHVKVFVS